jgi:hypothetical protein
MKLIPVIFVVIITSVLLLGCLGDSAENYDSGNGDGGGSDTLGEICNYEVTEDKTLDSDIYCITDGIKMKTSWVTLDCNGHSINFVGNHEAAEQVGIYVYYARKVNIKNCIINNFGTGLKFYSGTDVGVINNQIIDSHIRGVFIGKNSYDINFENNKILNTNGYDFDCYHTSGHDITLNGNTYEVVNNNCGWSA